MTPSCLYGPARDCRGRHRAAPRTAPRHYTAPLLARLVEPERPKTGGLEGTYITPRSVRAHVHTPGVTGSKRGGSLESVTLCASAGWPTARPACPHLHGRGFCPSCGGGRMADTAAHLVDRVLPEVPARRWVLSFAFQSVQDSNLHAGNISPLIPGTYVDHGPSSAQCVGQSTGDLNLSSLGARTTPPIGSPLRFRPTSTSKKLEVLPSPSERTLGVCPPPQAG